jgi:glycosyltransferase involved in cell wall biosynthesis
LNILFVSDTSIASVIGGAERVLFEQSTRLAKRGHNVHLLTRRLPSHKANRESIQGVTEWRYNLYRENALSFAISTYRNGRRLFELLQTIYGFECINFHQPFSALGVIQSAFSRRVRKVYTCHSLSFEEFISRNAEPGGLLEKALWLLSIHVRKWIERKVLRHSDKIAALSQFTQKRLWDAYSIAPQRVSIIPGGVDLNRFKPAGDRMDIRRRLKVPEDKVVFFTVRNLVQRMGLENLIMSIKEVVQTAPDIYLLLGGEGPLREDLSNLVNNLGLEDFVELRGYLPEEELPEYYQIADFFVLPTRELEGFGLVTLEAMASGVPVLGTPIGGTKEILGRFDSNLLLRDNNASSIAESMIKFYHLIKQNPENWKELSRRCRDFVEYYYSWEINVDALEELFFSEGPMCT